MYCELSIILPMHLSSNFYKAIFIKYNKNDGMRILFVCHIVVKFDFNSWDEKGWTDIPFDQCELSVLAMTAVLWFVECVYPCTCMERLQSCEVLFSNPLCC